MSRKDALLRLNNTLLVRRDHLRHKLAGELAHLGHYSPDSGDSADVAFDSGSDEMASHLAELDARDLSQIDRALERLRQGTYGICEVCNCKIPVARLNALPYTTLCIKCQREMETQPGWKDRRAANAWDKACEAETSLEEPRAVRLSDLEVDLSTR